MRTLGRITRRRKPVAEKPPAVDTAKEAVCPAETELEVARRQPTLGTTLSLSTGESNYGDELVDEKWLDQVDVEVPGEEWESGGAAGQSLSERRDGVPSNPAEPRAPQERDGRARQASFSSTTDEDELSSEGTISVEDVDLLSGDDVDVEAFMRRTGGVRRATVPENDKNTHVQPRRFDGMYSAPASTFCTAAEVSIAAIEQRRKALLADAGADDGDGESSGSSAGVMDAEHFPRTSTFTETVATSGVVTAAASRNTEHSSTLDLDVACSRTPALNADEPGRHSVSPPGDEHVRVFSRRAEGARLRASSEDAQPPPDLQEPEPEARVAADEVLLVRQLKESTSPQPSNDASVSASGASPAASTDALSNNDLAAAAAAPLGRTDDTPSKATRFGRLGAHAREKRALRARAAADNERARRTARRVGLFDAGALGRRLLHRAPSRGVGDEPHAVTFDPEASTAVCRGAAAAARSEDAPSASGHNADAQAEPRRPLSKRASVSSVLGGLSQVSTRLLLRHRSTSVGASGAAATESKQAAATAAIAVEEEVRSSSASILSEETEDKPVSSSTAEASGRSEGASAEDGENGELRAVLSNRGDVRAAESDADSEGRSLSGDSFVRVASEYSLADDAGALHAEHSSLATATAEDKSVMLSDSTNCHSSGNGRASVLDCVVAMLAGTPVTKQMRFGRYQRRWLYLDEGLLCLRWRSQRREEHVGELALCAVCRVDLRRRSMRITTHRHEYRFTVAFDSRTEAKAWLRGLHVLLPRDAAVLDRRRERAVAPTYDPLCDSWRGQLLSACKRINNYLLLGNLAYGSFGKVKLALSMNDRRFYALKIIADSQKIKRVALQSEREVAARLQKMSHPHVLVHREILYNEEKQKVVYVLEYMPRGPVQDCSQLEGNAPMEEELVRNVARDVVSGLLYLHSVGIVHRDIKPANLLRSGYGCVKISDFGEAKHYGMRFRDDKDSAGVPGTPAFLAPEFCVSAHCPRGNPEQFAVDVWSLGASLFYLAFGTVPFTASSILGMYDAICKDKLSFPVDAGPPPSAAFQHLLEAMLTKDPTRRITLADVATHPWFGNDRPKNLRSLPLQVTDSDMKVAIQPAQWTRPNPNA